MKFKEKKQIQVKQHDITDCGAACLASVIRYHKGRALISNIREICGTDKQGTSMLGLLKAAEELGFKASGVKGEHAGQFKEVPLPAIAHVLIEEHLEHYMVVYSASEDTLEIMDPADGQIKKFSYSDFEKIWKSRAVLLLEAKEDFSQNESTIPDKKEWLLKLLKPEAQRIYQGIFLGLIYSVLGIATSIYVQKIIDDFIPNKNTEKLILSTSLILLILVSRLAFNFLRQSFMIKMAKNLNNQLIDSFYAILLRLKKSFFDTRKTGEFIARMNDSVKIQQSVLQIVNVAAVDVLMLVVSLLYVVIMDEVLGLISLILIPIYILIVWRYLTPIKDAHREVMKDYALVESNYVDHITGIDVIKSKNKEGLFQKINQLFFERLQNSIFYLGKLDIKVGLISELVSGVLMIGILGFGASMVIHGKLSTGELLAIFSILGALVPAVARIASINLSIQQAFVSFDRLFEFMTLMPEDVAKETDKKVEAFQTLELRNIDFRYNGRKQILYNISLKISKGEQIALVGESGSGKTTIGHLIQQFYFPESGQILWNKKLMSDYDLHELRSRIAIVPQELKIFNGTVFENITLGEENMSPENVQQFLEANGLSDFINKFPNGILTLVGEEGINLSGGQKQILALARALFSKPELLILDEAVSALDMESEANIRRIISKLQISYILITHRLSTIRDATRIYVMREGKIIEEGNHESLLEKDAYYTSLYNFQMGGKSNASYATLI